jgi:hypothetical protein
MEEAGEAESQRSKSKDHNHRPRGARAIVGEARRAASRHGWIPSEPANLHESRRRQLERPNALTVAVGVPHRLNCHQLERLNAAVGAPQRLNGDGWLERASRSAS